MPQQLEFDFDGAGPLPTPQEFLDLEIISQLIGDPTTPIHRISRLIARQIATLFKTMTDRDPQRRRVPQRVLNARLKGYRGLHRSLLQNPVPARRDIFDLEGPSFRFVFSEMIRLFRSALDDSGSDPELAQNVMSQFTDLVKANDEPLRQGLAQI